ncbi:DUF4158 domain-containing protein [Ruegeria sp. SCP11]|uniref:DUF4158 domain-containing protein n=1 Tax=Ruegeria sp. SCP11 TaxID=3141378 RepID=UPI003334BFF6
MILEDARIGARAFSSPLSELEIDLFSTLSPEEISTVCDRRGRLNRLGLAPHLSVVKMTGRAELSTNLVPQAVLVHVAGQLDVPSPSLASLRSLYRDRSRLIRHRKMGVELAGFRGADTGAPFGLLQYLRQEVLATTAADVLRGKVMRWLHARKYVVFPARDIRSLVRREVERREKKLAALINGDEGSKSRQWIEDLAVDLEPCLRRFEWLLAGPPAKAFRHWKPRRPKSRFCGASLLIVCHWTCPMLK